MNKRYLNIALFVAGLFFMISCSTERNTRLSRTYHNLTAHYNAYFNGKESLKKGVKKIDEGHQDDYDRILPIVTYSKPEEVATAFPDMDKSIQKASKVIKLHSITAKPKRKGRMTKKKKEFYKKKEYCKWIDNSYLLMGKAHFFKHDFFQAAQNFKYIMNRFEGEKIVYDAMLWLARTYCEEGKYDKAKEMLDQLEGDREFPRRLKGEMSLVYADYYLKQEQYEDVIPKIREAIDKAKRRNKARYKFILAQIYQRLKEYNKASILYGEVVKHNPEYEMAFNAKINRAEAYSSGSGDVREIKKQLLKMLRDDKNIDFQDQIYYALANIEFKEGNVEKAIEYYLLSAKTSVSNANQQALSYLALADIYFSYPDYPKAQQYYDSTMTFLSTSYPTYDDLAKKTKNLNELIENLNTIHFQDSVQKLRTMDRKDLDKLIDKKIQEVIDEEERQRELLEQQQMDNMLLNQNRVGAFNNNNNNNQGGKWYFYNQMMISSGSVDFKRKWGSRKLEDNWRRKNKSVVAIDEFANEDGTSTDSTKNNKQLSNKSKEFYMQHIPFSDSALKASNEKIYLAMYNVGRIYKDKLEDYPESIKSFEGLISRNKETDYTLSTYYYLFNIFAFQKNDSKATYYKNLIIAEFPDSETARMLTNPNYWEELAAEKAKVQKNYAETYNSYLRGDYRTVVTNCNRADSVYIDHPLIPKYAFLKALTVGKISNVETFKKALNSVITNYPDTEEKTAAEEMLAYVSDVKLDSLQQYLASLEFQKDINETDINFNEYNNYNSDTNPTDTAQLNNPNDNVVEVEKEIYSLNPTESHFYVVIMDKNDVDVNRVRFNISSYNIDFFSMFEFNVGRPVVLEGDIQMISVKSFVDQEVAMKYFMAISNNPDVYGGLKDTQYRHFVISAKNFPVFYGDKDVQKYIDFFKEKYLEQ